MSKRCPYCHCNTEVIRFGIASSGRQRYRCKDCKRTWTNKPRPSKLSDKIWHDLVWNNMPVRALENKYHKCGNTIRSIINQYQPSELDLIHLPEVIKQQVKVIIMDTTYFGRSHGIVTFIDAHTNRLLYFQEINRSEIIQDYIDGLETIRRAGINPVACVVDGRRGLINAMEHRGLYVQVCLFHIQLIVRKYLTNTPILEPNKELKIITELLCHKKIKLDRFHFASILHGFFVRNEKWLNERTRLENGKYEFTHQDTRKAYQAIQKHFPWLFTYEKHPELNIPRTSNKIEGKFGNAKDKLKLHHGYTKELKTKIFFSLLSGE